MHAPAASQLMLPPAEVALVSVTASVPASSSTSLSFDWTLKPEVPAPTTTGALTLRWTVDEGHILPNTPISARWRIQPTLEDPPVVGPEVRTVYEDDRFAWRTVSGDVVSFCFPAKSGVERRAEVRDPALARAVSALKRSRGPSDRLLQYRAEEVWCELTSTEINKDFKELVGAEYTVKDLRTWAATLLAAAAFAERADGAAPRSERQRRTLEREVMTMVSEHLGNTAAVARRSYVDARVVDEYAAGRTIARALARASAPDRRRLRQGDLAEVNGRAALERAVVRLLR